MFEIIIILDLHTEDRERSPDKMEFLIWSDSELRIQQAKTQLSRALDKDLKKEIIKQSYSDVIQELADSQVIYKLYTGEFSWLP